MINNQQYDQYKPAKNKRKHGQGIDGWDGMGWLMGWDGMDFGSWTLMMDGHW